MQAPIKTYFKVEEVCDIIGIRPYVLRFWEAEFSEISSIRSSNGQKIYEQRDIEILLKIKELLFGQKLTVEKAKLELPRLLTQNQEIEVNIEEEEDSFALGPQKLEALVIARQKLDSMLDLAGNIRSSRNWH